MDIDILGRDEWGKEAYSKTWWLIIQSYYLTWKESLLLLFSATADTGRTEMVEGWWAGQKSEEGSGGIIPGRAEGSLLGEDSPSIHWCQWNIEVPYYYSILRGLQMMTIVQLSVIIFSRPLSPFLLQALYPSRNFPETQSPRWWFHFG